jgi:hypothetical protein
VFYVIIFFKIRLSSTCRTRYFHHDLDFRSLLFRLKMFSSHLVIPCVACYTPKKINFCSLNFC